MDFDPQGAVTLCNVSCNLSHKTSHSVTYLATDKSVAGKVAETVAESREHGSTFRNDFRQRSASLRSHMGSLPIVNASAMFRVTCLAMRCETSCTKDCTVWQRL